MKCGKMYLYSSGQIVNYDLVAGLVKQMIRWSSLVIWLPISKENYQPNKRSKEQALYMKLETLIESVINEATAMLRWHV